MLFLGETESCRLELAHTCQLFLLLKATGVFFLKIGLAAGFFLLSFSLETETFSLGEFGPALSLSSFLLLALLFDFLAELLFFFLLLLNDGEVGLLLFVFVFDHARFLTICLFIIFSINSSVVLVLPTSTLALGFAILELVVLIDSASEQVSLLAVQLAHKVLLTLVTLDSHLVDGILDLGLGVNIVFEATDHVILGEFVVTVILFLMPRR